MGSVKIMGLSNIKLTSVLMNTSTNNLIDEFYIPLLKESIEYKRGVGFFSSGWLKMVSEGLSHLIINGGRIKLITSPILSVEDYKAIEKGIKKDSEIIEIIENAIIKSIDELQKFIEEDTLSAIAWMIADEILEIKLAIPRNKLTGDFHDKFGIFIDKEGNKIAFSGSPNESIQGFQNYESIKIFPSWKDGFKEIAEAEENRFDSLWNNEDPNVKVYSLSEASKEKILKLRTKNRPYEEKNILKAFKGDRLLNPRIYQKEAVSKWEENGCKGIFEMATGTGKTLTSIFAINEFTKRNKQNLIVILVPFVHLLEQWKKSIEPISKNIISCYGSKKNWTRDLEMKIILQNQGKIDNLFIISTIQTAARDELKRIIHKSKVSSLIVIDECHYAGAPKFSTVLDEFFKARIGLSATPIRMWDDLGTEELENYFNGIVYKFSLERAMKEGFLTQYEYNPILVELTDQEFEEYERLSSKIVKVLNNPKLSREDIDKKLEGLLIERSRILNGAVNKLEELKKVLDKIGSLKYSLFYCDYSQFDKVFDIIKGMNILAVKFTAEETKEEREKILEKFANGEIDALVAMKCLDEGVDVPATKVAFFLSNSTNERQFIQRRGRILRKHPGKEKAYIYDFITVPPTNAKLTKDTQSILKRELKRFREFSDHALNKYEAISIIHGIINKYGLLGEV